MVGDTEAMVARHTAGALPRMAAAAAAAVGARRPAEARRPAMVPGHPTEARRPAMVLRHPAAVVRKAAELPARPYDTARPPPSRTPGVHIASASRSREVRQALQRPTLTVVALASSWGRVRRSVDVRLEVRTE